MNIVALQWDARWLDSTANLIELETKIPHLFQSYDKIDFLILPELFHGGFSMQPKYFAECLEGEVSSTLAHLALKYQIHIVAGVAQKTISTNCEVEQVRYYNAALAFDNNGKKIARYIKQKSFSFAKEQAVYNSGFQPQVFYINDEPFAVFICYDLRFPELFRQVAQQVKGMIVIANWPDSRQAHWETLLKARAIENQCFFIGVNRIGEDGNGLHYIGGSMVISPLGEVIAYGGVEDQSVFAAIDINQTDKVRQQFPFLADITLNE